MCIRRSKYRKITNNIETCLGEVIGCQMGTYIMIVSTIKDILLPFRQGKKKRIMEYSDWGLGVDCCFHYSSPFSVHNRSITIVGFQEVLAEGETIRYSVVRKNWWGKRTIYGQGSILGNYKSPHCFQLSIEGIPNGGNYQVEVFNGFYMACGQFTVKS